MLIKTILVDEASNNLRIDVFLAPQLGMPRSQVQRLIKEGFVRVHDSLAKASYKVRTGEVIDVLIEERNLDLKPFYSKLDIAYEDEYLLVINKPAGLVVHPAFGHNDDTLVNALVAHNMSLSDVGGTFRPGIVHRLDKNTSGLLIVCKNNEVHNKMAKLIKDHQVVRRYTALVKGNLTESSGKITTYLRRSKTNYQKMENNPSEGKLAISTFEVKERFNGYLLLEVELKTGRTHQIRAHMEYIGTPVVGDDLYGKNNRDLYKNGQLLHAGELVFIHPYTNEKLVITAPLPDYFNDILTKLRTNL